MVKKVLTGSVADQLRAAILASELSLSKLADAAGLGDHSRLSRFARGERDLTLEAASRVCNVLGLTLTEDPLAIAANGRPRKPSAASPGAPAAETLPKPSAKPGGPKRAGKRLGQ